MGKEELMGDDREAGQGWPAAILVQHRTRIYCRECRKDQASSLFRLIIHDINYILITKSRRESTGPPESPSHLRYLGRCLRAAPVWWP